MSRPRKKKSRKNARTISDDTLELIVRGVFAYTMATSAAADEAIRQHQDALLRRQAAELN